MATEGQVVGSLMQKAARLKGRGQKVGSVFDKTLLTKDKVESKAYEVVNVQSVEIIRGVVLKRHIVKNFVVPDRKVTIENTGHHINAIYTALSDLKRETEFTVARVAAVPEKSAEQRTVEWLGSETERLRTLLSERIDKDREHQKHIKAALRALREGI